jgi:hypothetical protein
MLTATWTINNLLLFGPRNQRADGEEPSGVNLMPDGSAYVGGRMSPQLLGTCPFHPYGNVSR